MKASGWRDSVGEFIRAEALPVDKYGHQPRLYAIATRVASGMDYDDDILFAAAWMHDLGVFSGHRPRNQEDLEKWDHVPYTVARSIELLEAWGFPPEKLDGVADAIRTHQPQDEPVRTEAVILRDADMLEQLGAVGAMRAFAKIGRDTRFPTFTSVIPVLQKAVNQLPGRMRLTNSMDLAKPRVALLRSFLAAIEEEAGDLLF